MRKIALALAVALALAGPAAAATYSVTTTDPHQLAGLAAAQAAYNAAQPATVADPNDSTKTVPTPTCVLDATNHQTNAPCLFSDPAQYWQWVAGNAFDSYAKQYGQ